MEGTGVGGGVNDPPRDCCGSIIMDAVYTLQDRDVSGYLEEECCQHPCSRLTEGLISVYSILVPN